MGRKPRVWLPGGYYHIVCRGNRRDALFLSELDYVSFYKILDSVYEKIKFELPVFCLMTNHFHLMVRTWEEPVAKVMSLLNKRYANYFNTRYCLTGHVFEKRYYAQMLADDRSVLEVSKYIHRNPLEAKMVKQLDQYPWSSYRFYTQSNEIPPGYVKPDSILRYFSGETGSQRQAYQRYVEDASHHPKHVEKAYLSL
jgi:putative transposase